MDTEEIVTLTERLVAVPSHEDETAAGDVVESWLCEHTDAEVERDGAGSVLARKGTGDRSLALVGHHDVVPPAPDQVDEDGYVVERRGGRIYGRGAADMKGAVAAAMVAFRDADPTGELVFASFVGEETGGVGVRHAIEAGFRPDYAVVGEGSTNYSGPGVTDVVVVHRGRRGSTVTAHGEAAHASEAPEAGRNAIYAATDAVDVVRQVDLPTVEVLGHEVSGSATVTEITGGTSGNVVPDRCSFTVDERTVPGARADLSAVEAVDGVEWTVDRDTPPMACSDERFADLVLEAAQAAQAVTPETVVKPHATDAGWLAQNGTACVICGPCEKGEAHTSDESVAVEALDRCAHIYRNAAEAEWPSRRAD